VEHDPPEHRRLLVELHRRFSLSFSCMVFAALGFFIGTFSQRGVRSTAIVICMSVALVYWLAYVLANALSVSGSIPPWFGIWFPNVFFGAVAYFCYRRKVRVR
jgi:lipopolysaccharide export LptBFGC system permease protein LptF